MRNTAFLLASLVLSALAPDVTATDLPKIDRSFAKEPKYTQAPKYFLLVFGPEARTRVWCVFDGNKLLYVDRNGNGDLTEDGERFPLNEDENRFLVGDITESDKITHRNLRISPPTLLKTGGPEYFIIEVEIKGEYLMYSSINLVESMGRPQDAPFRHFRGPMTARFVGENKLQLVRGKELPELAIALGTFYPHRLKGLFVEPGVYVNHAKGVPKDVHPIAEITFPARTPDAKPVVLKVPLTQRC